MSSAFVLDTHTHIKRLMAAGIPEAHAEAHVQVQADLLRAALGEQGAQQKQATAQAVHQAAQEFDGKSAQAIMALKHHLDAGLADLKSNMDVGLAEARGEITRVETRTDGQFRLLHWMLGILIALLMAVALKVFLG